MDLTYVTPFLESSKSVIMQMAGVEIKSLSKPYVEEGSINSYGVASIINFSGKIKGRFLLDISPNLALSIAQNILGEPCQGLKDRMLLAAISEMNNIIAGDANTILNNKLSLGLRLAPPIVLSGSSLILVTPRISSLSATGSTEYGDIRFNIGFQGGVF